MTFWDFCSPVYDFAQKRNANYEKWNNLIVDYIDEDTHVLEIAAGTGEISIRIADKAKKVVCTDLSEKMLKVAKQKAAGKANIKFQQADIYNLNFNDSEFDTVIASQVLHLLGNPQKAIDELKRVCKDKLIFPICLTKNIKGFAKFQVNLWRLLGFNPKHNFDEKGYLDFLKQHNLKISESILIEGSMPIIIVICKK